MHKLIIEDDEGKTTVVPVSRGEITIGRMEGNTIRLMERNVSRRHARLLRDNGAIFIEDLNSFNGVKINGERIDRRLEIKEGDLVEIGDYHLALQRVEVEDEPAVSRAETVLSGPPATQASQSHDHHHAGANGGAKQDAQWRASLAGTVPDFRLPQEILAEARAELDARERAASGGQQVASAPLPETVRDLTSPQAQHARSGPSAPGFAQEPLVSPPPPKEMRQGPSLPPFPASGLTGPGGLAAPTVNDSSQIPALRREDASALRTEQIQVGPARSSDVPRLVCVSTEYAGREFSINRPEVIIGRVEDNDVVIEHRSVSRNHAKILFDGRVHKIIDLESANGILVNGEEYAITDLRKNDLIELGHVKFRFVPAGEAFVPNEEEVKAMLEAGVSPPSTAPVPSRPFEPPTLPHKTNLNARDNLRTEEAPAPDMSEIGSVQVNVDPSTAATVTDTPISALGVAELFQPKVEAPPPVVPDPPAAKPAPAPLPPPAREARRDTVPDPSPRSSVRVGGAAEARRVGLRDPATTKDDEDDLRSPHAKPSGKGKLFAALFFIPLLLGGLGYLVWTLSGGPRGNADEQLKALYDKGDYSAVETFYYEHGGEFEDPKAAFNIMSRAKEAQQKNVPAPLETPPKTEGTPSPTVSPEPSGELPPGEEDAPVEELKPQEEETAAAETNKTKARVEARKNKARKAPAAAETTPGQEPDKLAFRLMAEGDDARAKDVLQACLRKTPKNPGCQRMMGYYFDNKKEYGEAWRYYKRYIDQNPNAEDYGSIRARLKKLEDDGFGPQ